MFAAALKMPPTPSNTTPTKAINQLHLKCTDTVAPAFPSSDDTTAAAPQPLTRADCEKASMKWNDATNVCGSSQDASDAAAAAAPVVALEKKKRELKKGEKKVVKKVMTAKGTKKTTVYKKAPKSYKKDAATKKEQRRFFKWLKQQDKAKS